MQKHMNLKNKNLKNAFMYHKANIAETSHQKKFENMHKKVWMSACAVDAYREVEVSH